MLQTAFDRFTHKNIERRASVETKGLAKESWFECFSGKIAITEIEAML